MTKPSSSESDQPKDLRVLSPEEFLEHAQSLLSLEWGHHKSDGSFEPKAKRISSLAQLATDVLADDLKERESVGETSTKVVPLHPRGSAK